MADASVRTATGAGLAEEVGADRRVIASGHRCDTSAAAALVNSDHIIDAGKLPSGTVVHARGARSSIELRELHSIGLQRVVHRRKSYGRIVSWSPPGRSVSFGPRPVVESLDSAAVLVVLQSECDRVHAVCSISKMQLDGVGYLERLRFAVRANRHNAFAAGISVPLGVKRRENAVEDTPRFMGRRLDRDRLQATTSFLVPELDAVSTRRTGGLAV